MTTAITGAPNKMFASIGENRISDGEREKKKVARIEISKSGIVGGVVRAGTMLKKKKHEVGPGGQNEKVTWKLMLWGFSAYAWKGKTQLTGVWGLR